MAEDLAQIHDFAFEFGDPDGQFGSVDEPLAQEGWWLLSRRAGGGGGGGAAAAAAATRGGGGGGRHGEDSACGGVAVIEISEEFVGVGAEVMDGARGRIEGIRTYCCGIEIEIEIGIEIGGVKSSTGGITATVVAVMDASR